MCNKRIHVIVYYSFNNSEINETNNQGDSAPLLNAENAGGVNSHQNVTFMDGGQEMSTDVETTYDTTFDYGFHEDSQLADFLSRPILVTNWEWTPGSTTDNTKGMRPWTEYFNNPSVQEKINYFRNMRCNLRMKFVVNGNPFYYGRLLVSYNPYTAQDNVTRFRSSDLTDVDIVEASQRPHIFIDPTTSEAGEMTLPFIYPYNFVDITKPGWGHDLGQLMVYPLTPIQHANGSTLPFEVSVYIWAEDVKLTVPTHVPAADAGPPSDFVRQAKGKPNKTSNTGAKKRIHTNNRVNSGVVGEFKSDGLISKPASAIANAANALMEIPILAPYAKATEMVATKVGQIARLFGYSRPQVLADTMSLVPRYAGNMSNTDAPEPLVKLAVDSKNELSIDSRVCGLSGEDEMLISRIAGHESYLNYAEWRITNTPGTPLASFVVTPGHRRTLIGGAARELHYTPLTFAATPFDYWQGSIIFRFQIVASAYHKGRLRIEYQPTGAVASAQYNQSYSTVVDISKDRDVEFEVKWADVKAWQRTPPHNQTNDDFHSVQKGESSATYLNGDFDYSNGSLTVSVVNSLTSPSSSTTPVYIACWVRGGDDFAVAAPSLNRLRPFSMFQRQASGKPTETDCVQDVETLASGMHVPLMDYAGEMEQDNQYLVYFGERILSFRDLIKRYQFQEYVPLADTTSAGSQDRYVMWQTPDFPPFRGFDPIGIGTAKQFEAPNDQVPFTWANNTLLNFLAPAFIMRRGGMRHKAILHATNDANYPGIFAAIRDTQFSPYGLFEQQNNLNALNINLVRKYGLGTSLDNFSGMHITAPKNNPVLEYETPFYADGFRWIPARHVRLDNFNEIPKHTIMSFAEASDSKFALQMWKFVAAAEDTNFSFFISTPVLHLYDNPLAPGE